MPNENKYRDLLHAYADTLSCLCSRLTTVYGDFLSLPATFHQVCSSPFVSQSFTDARLDPNASYYNPLDIRATFSAQLHVSQTKTGLLRMCLGEKEHCCCRKQREVELFFYSCSVRFVVKANRLLTIHLSAYWMILILSLVGSSHHPY